MQVLQVSGWSPFYLQYIYFISQKQAHKETQVWWQQVMQAMQIIMEQG